MTEPARPLADPEIRSAALVRLRVGLGDLLASVPALRALRTARPDVHVSLVTWDEMRPVVDQMRAYVDELIAFPGFRGIPERPVDSEAVEPFFAAMRARRFDLAVQMYGALPAANEVTERIGARVTGGFFDPRLRRPDRGTHLPYPERRHEIHRHLDLMAFLGTEPGSDALEFPLTKADEVEAAAVLAERGVRGRYAVLHPGATARSRRWPPERFAAVGDHLADRGLGVIVSGARGEEGLTGAVVRGMRAPAVDVCGETSLGGFAALLARARLLVGNESGPVQLASALGVPSVSLFFAGDRERWRPLDGARHVALAAGVECQPCGLLECPIDFRCATRLSMEEVVRAADSLLGPRRRGRSETRSRHDVVVLGGGVTGLAAGRASAAPVLEASDVPGGICASYYVRPNGDPERPERLTGPPPGRDAYRFEVGGGHWLFGGDPHVLGFLEGAVPLARRVRRSAVYFAGEGRVVPYPLQRHLDHLDPSERQAAERELAEADAGDARTMAEWLERRFGPTLCARFFAPFHQRYTAGLWTEIAPQDGYKTPGGGGRDRPAGYNATFAYPAEAGLEAVVDALADGCDVRVGHRAAAVDFRRKEVALDDGGTVPFGSLLSTLPLDDAVTMAGLDLLEVPDPATSVLVLNIGGRRGPDCPDEHWLYVPDADSGFHRVGIYSAVDRSFVPGGSPDLVGLYVERAFRRGHRPRPAEVDGYVAAVLEELRRWRFLDEVHVVDRSWVEVAYTWRRPASRWRETALDELEQRGVRQIGRYGRWRFQGIADSIAEGLVAGAAV